MAQDCCALSAGKINFRRQRSAQRGLHSEQLKIVGGDIHTINALRFAIACESEGLASISGYLLKDMILIPPGDEVDWRSIEHLSPALVRRAKDDQPLWLRHRQ